MAKPTKIFKAHCLHGNYDVTALGHTAAEAKQAVLDSLEAPVKEAGHHENAEAFWDYMGGSVTEMEIGKAEWL